MAWEVEAALRKMKNLKEAGKDQVNIETLKAGDETIAKQLAKLYTECITERRIPKTWKEANMVIFFKKGNRRDIKNYRPIFLLSNMYKLLTKIITTRLEKKLDEHTDSSVTVHLHKEGEKITIKRPLETIFRRLNWENKGVKIDREFLSNLRFADDIFLCTETSQELQNLSLFIQQVLQELSDESRRMGLKMNSAKIKVMVVDNTPINVNNVLIENVPGYVYLGQHYSIKEKNQFKEIQRRIMAGSPGWAAYAKHRNIFKSNLAICLKRQVYNSCVPPAMTYGAETCMDTDQNKHRTNLRTH